MFESYDIKAEAKACGAVAVNFGRHGIWVEFPGAFSRSLFKDWVRQHLLGIWVKTLEDGQGHYTIELR